MVPRFPYQWRLSSHLEGCKVVTELLDLFDGGHGEAGISVEDLGHQAQVELGVAARNVFGVLDKGLQPHGRHVGQHLAAATTAATAT